MHDSPKLRLALCFDRQNGAPVARGHDRFLEKLGVVSRSENAVERFLEFLSQPAERGAKLRELGARIVAQIALLGVDYPAELSFELLQIGELLRQRPESREVVLFGAEAASGFLGDARKDKERNEIRHRERAPFDAEGVEKRSHIG